ncbi:MAG: hypothetical protein RLO80_13200 [Hyphomonas sp.]
MLRHSLPVAAALGALMAGCAQTGSVQEAGSAWEKPAVWRPFSDDSPWNTRIAANPAIDPNSDVLIADVGAGGALYINMPEWSVMVKYFDSALAPKTRMRSLYPGQHGAGFEPGAQIPMPEDALPPETPASESYYFTMVDPVRNLAWDIRQLAKTPEGAWISGFGEVVDLNGTGVPKPWMQAERGELSAGVRPSGIPLMAGLIRVDEVKAGRIDHALAFAYPQVRTGKFLPPASLALEAGGATEERLVGLPVGARIQLDPDFDIDNTKLSPGAKVVARALQDYGAILVDHAGATVLFAESGPEQLEAWQGVLAPGDLQLLFTRDFISLNFRVMEMGEPLPGIPSAYQ